jgi:Phytanoyl-CoA dioxygenase (PhyH)
MGRKPVKARSPREMCQISGCRKRLAKSLYGEGLCRLHKNDNLTCPPKRSEAMVSTGSKVPTASNGPNVVEESLIQQPNNDQIFCSFILPAGKQLLQELETSYRSGNWMTVNGNARNTRYRRFEYYKGKTEPKKILRLKVALIDAMLKQKPELAKLGDAHGKINSSKVSRITIPAVHYTRQIMHTDSNDDSSQQHQPHTAATVILLSQKTTKKNGATQVWPDSIHKPIDSKHPSSGHLEESCIYLVGQRGDAWVFDVLMHHRGGKNLTDKPRTIFSFVIGDVEEHHETMSSINEQK